MRTLSNIPVWGKMKGFFAAALGCALLLAAGCHAQLPGMGMGMPGMMGPGMMGGMPGGIGGMPGMMPPMGALGGKVSRKKGDKSQNVYIQKEIKV